ncbi:enoyl-CoA hydratase-related protein [Sphingosinithalassobacter portus]|uniref:enoyl-CoA hydratase-related protein n=1 Tax=Stakelama portus TaxID=2676234 RepID=UPI000D6E1AAD|nr:enoyl-CoA hydratase-related protein [Sphingosinithalassobacter portus]
MTLSLSIHDAVATIAIDRSEKRNAFTREMWEALPRLIAQAQDSADARMLVLRSAAGGAFSAGADIGEFAQNAADRDWLDANQRAIAQAQKALSRCPLPTVAMVEGDCFGGGCGLAIACDLRVAGSASRFAITPARLGLVYSLHDTKLLVDLVGPAQAKRILFTAQPVDAAEAFRIGLVDVLDDRPDVLIAPITANSSHSIAASKAIIRRILDGQADDDTRTEAMFAEAFDKPDFAEGVAAFLARRKPEFK